MVGIASLFLVERAYECYNNWIRREVLMIGKILRRNFGRFGDQALQDMVEGFVKMRQEGGVDEHEDRSEI